MKWQSPIQGGLDDDTRARVLVDSIGMLAKGIDWRGSEAQMKGLPSNQLHDMMTAATTDAKRLWLWDGTGWIIMYEPVQQYTPVWTNLTLGTGATNSINYNRSGGYMDFVLVTLLGTGGAVSGSVSFTLPFNVRQVRRYQLDVTLLDGGVNNYRGVNESADGVNTVSVYATAGNAATGLEVAQVLAAATPFVWNAGDGIFVAGRVPLFNIYS